MKRFELFLLWATTIALSFWATIALSRCVEIIGDM